MGVPFTSFPIPLIKSSPARDGNQTEGWKSGRARVITSHPAYYYPSFFYGGWVIVDILMRIFRIKCLYDQIAFDIV